MIDVKNRIVEYPNRVKLTKVDNQVDVYDMKTEQGVVYQEGTPIDSDLFNQFNEELDTAIDDFQTQLDGKSDKAYVDTELEKKSDKSYVDIELDKKVAKTELYQTDTTIIKKEQIPTDIAVENLLIDVPNGKLTVPATDFYKYVAENGEKLETLSDTVDDNKSAQDIVNTNFETEIISINQSLTNYGLYLDEDGYLCQKIEGENE